MRAPLSPAREAPAVVGRDSELEAIARLLARPAPALLEIEGEAGIGKTTLWEEGVRRARAAGALVLAARPVEIETGVSYGALAALLEPALEHLAGDVPAPRRRALEGALRLRDAPVSSLDEAAVALGATSLLRGAARGRDVLVAVEDVQWLDLSSRVALTYALRNLRAGDRVRVLVTRRLGEGEPLDLAGAPLSQESELLRPGPLSAGAVHRIVTRRLGAPLPRPKLVRIHEASRGNPFHALELARAVAAAETGDVALAIPPSLGDALRVRIGALSDAARTLLLVVAASGEAGAALLEQALEGVDVHAALAEAVDAGVLALAAGTVRFSHPLLASTVYGDATEGARRDLHRRLAELAGSAEAGARHLALAGSGPDENIAGALAGAAAAACRRGARGSGAGLYEQAAALTPPGDTDGRARRLVDAAQAHFQSGDAEHARLLLERAAETSVRLRFEALCALGILLDETVGGAASLPILEQVLASGDLALTSRAHRGLAQAHAYVGDLGRALDHADAAVEHAQELGEPAVLVFALAMQALVRKMSGRPDWRTPLRLGLALEATLDLPDLDGCPGAVEADTLRLELELDEAHAAYEGMLARAAELGDVRTECWCRFGLAAVDVERGRWERAEAHAAELADLADQTGTFRLPALRTSAHVALLRGDVERARSLLAGVRTEAEPAGELHNLRTALQLEGLLELSLGRPGDALAPLRRAREIAERMAIGEPSMLTFLLDEVEGHALVGDPASAVAVLMTFDRRCDGRAAPWIVPLGLRARGIVEAASGDLGTACDTLAAAVAAEDDLPLPLQRARTRLAYGRVLRRLQRRARARSELGRALARFEELGAGLWAARAREELGRVGGRAASSDDLTPTEQRIAELVAEGRSNREVGAALFVTPKTVESALTRIYRKLGVRSRTELARRLPAAAG